jgi:hypothetical protein
MKNIWQRLFRVVSVDKFTKKLANRTLWLFDDEPAECLLVYFYAFENARIIFVASEAVLIFLIWETLIAKSN